MSTRTKQPSLKELISNTISDGKKLLTAQVNLTTTEVQQAGKAIGAISVLAIIAILLLSLGGLFLLIALAYVLVAIGLPIWAGFLIVAGVLVLIAGILGAVAYSKSKSLEGPSVAAEEWQKTSDSIAQITNRSV